MPWEALWHRACPAARTGPRLLEPLCPASLRPSLSRWDTAPAPPSCGHVPRFTALQAHHTWNLPIVRAMCKKTHQSHAPGLIYLFYDGETLGEGPSGLSADFVVWGEWRGVLDEVGHGSFSKDSRAQEPSVKSSIFISQPVSLKLNLVNLWNVCFSSLSWLPPLSHASNRAPSFPPVSLHICHFFVLKAPPLLIMDITEPLLRISVPQQAVRETASVSWLFKLTSQHSDTRQSSAPPPAPTLHLQEQYLPP